FYRPEYQKRKDKICPFSSLAFFQPTTVDKEPNFLSKCKSLGTIIQFILFSKCSRFNPSYSF
ncbi:hypothetical protein, partial [Streptococcus pneumoniae]|uniref:hypothetical protein n=3 Tax=Streptococcus pneumoniae TaxID=1313 RepID=UPI001C71ABF4